MRNYLTFILFCLCMAVSYGQSGTFAFALSGLEDDQTDQRNSTTAPSYKQKHLESILENLIETQGHFDRQKPVIHLAQSQQKPAWIEVNKGHLFVEEKMYDLCSELGADSSNALASIIAHELIHYYDDHDWHDHVLRFYGEAAGELDQSSMDRHLELEFQADQKGGFLAQMSGYESIKVLPTVLPMIYSAYGLKEDRTSLYPSLEQRVQIAEKSDEMLTQWVQLFDMSRYLTAIGDYQKAALYLDHIMHKGKFNSREMYNNLGMLYALSAWKMMHPKEMPFVLPFMFSQESRLGQRSNDDLKANLLQEAKNHFERAYQLDKSFHEALINQALVALLLKDEGEFTYLLNKAEKEISESDSKLQASLKTAKGISYHLAGDQKASLDKFQEAHKLSPSWLTESNLSIAEGQTSYPAPRIDEAEAQVGSYPLKQLYNKLMREEESASLQIELTEEEVFYQVDKTDHTLFIDFVYDLNDRYTFFSEGREMVLNGQNWKVGTSREQLENSLGKASGCLTGHLDLCTYPNHQLLVEYNDQDQVESFITYYYQR